jgi:uncharacterized protein (DUF433 family)
MGRINGSPDMELKASGFDIETPSGRKNGSSSRSTSLRDAKTNPRSRRVNRSTRADAFGAFADQVLSDLNPRGPLESVIAEHLVLSAWKLKGAIERQVTHLPAERENPDRSAEKVKRVSPSAADRAARSVKEALESLDYVRDRSKSSGTPRAVESFLDPIHGEIEPNEWPVVPFNELDELPIEEPIVGDDETPIWRDRLVFDFDISDVSPVIKGTWITVSHVVSLIVDGYTWADVLRSHPELTEEDVRVCVAYAVAQDQDED